MPIKSEHHLKQIEKRRKKNRRKPKVKIKDKNNKNLKKYLR